MSYNYFGNPYQPMTPPMQQTYRPAPTPTQAGNKIYCTSQEDALSRFVEPGTVMLFVRQDEAVEYEVFSDFQGRKNIVVYTRTPATGGNTATDSVVSPATEYVTAEKFNALQGRFEALERIVNGGKNE